MSTESIKNILKWVKDEKDSLDGFMHYCLDQQKKDPDNWPIETWTSEELYEQYDAYIETIHYKA